MSTQTLVPKVGFAYTFTDLSFAFTVSPEIQVLTASDLQSLSRPITAVVGDLVGKFSSLLSNLVLVALHVGEVSVGGYEAGNCVGGAQMKFGIGVDVRGLIRL